MNDISDSLSAIEQAISSSDPADLEVAAVSAKWLDDQITESKSDPAQMALWTSSTVVDGNAEFPLLNRRVFTWLHRGLPDAYGFPIGHAGLMHTYGYLLSPVVTAYGLKRERWLTADLAEAFGLKASFFYPTASAAPLMERVAHVALPTLTDPLATSGTVLALDEVVDESRKMRTVFVSNAGRNATAAVYGSVTDGVVQLVSAFPVKGFSAEYVVERLAGPTRYRYNYSPPGALPGSEFDGELDILICAR
ncbi:hypothetical protein GCM10007304_11670 [Rhodococcoides trifolii]|uniref:Uncharacterized protein n=1 Tax=Rhodococcoides trifolii TaxID=908250 RepID=A0A917FSE7_9NOCA|nr:hypothetical protein [Rhodococcus trifolii]GGF99473.1 hypothetical protein GCM10007304_11670 [Rhodococcus trifolii]